MLSSADDSTPDPDPQDQCSWTTVKKACLRKHNIKEVPNLSEEECKAACRNYVGDKECLSVDWHREKKICYLNYANRETQKVDPTCDKCNYHELHCNAGENQCFLLTNH